MDDAHFEYYGQSCIKGDAIVHMSCSDIDVLLLSSSAPRSGFHIVAGDGRGALDVHLIINGSNDIRQRKLENSLMGQAIIVDPVEGWHASYTAAAAKALPCPSCDLIDFGTEVGYENYPMEVYLPVALADGFPTKGGDLRNFLSLWAPTLLPGAVMPSVFAVQFKWWDGRERFFVGSRQVHAINEPLKFLDPRFDVANFVCGHTTDPFVAENDGFPRIGTDATACGAPSVPDTAHPSDNLETGFDLQPSTPIGWWRFQLLRDGNPPVGLPFSLANVHSGRGLVGVVLSTNEGELHKKVKHKGVGDATRLWHEDPCEIAQSGVTIGPPHKGQNNVSADGVTLFNIFNLVGQRSICSL